MYFFDNTIENAVNHLYFEFGNNIYINCRKMDDYIIDSDYEYKAQITWDDCP